MFFRRSKFRSFSRRRPRFHRRRFSRFKRSGRFRRSTNSYTAQRGSATALRFRGRRLPRRAWRRSLFGSTRHKAHYRSLNANIITGGTGTTQAVSTPLFGYAVGGSGTPADFWTVAGGLQIYDVNHTTPPLFQDDLVIRGGKVTLHVSVPATTTDAVGIRLFWVRTIKNSVAGQVVLGGFGPQPWGWDPSVFADFDQLIGKVIFSAEAVLNPDNRYTTFEIRVPIQKANQVDWLQGGPQIAWVLHTTNLSSTTNVPLSIVATWNLSFSGDTNGVSGTLALPTVSAPVVLRRTRQVADASSDVTMSSKRIK